MIANVTFVRKHNEDQTFKVNMFGPNKNHVKVNNILAVFKASIAIMFDGSMMEVDELGLNTNYLILDQDMLSLSFQLWIHVTFFQSFL
jgi:hypothetical protein